MLLKHFSKFNWSHARLLLLLLVAVVFSVSIYLSFNYQRWKMYVSIMQEIQVWKIVLILVFSMIMLGTHTITQNTLTLTSFLFTSFIHFIPNSFGFKPFSNQNPVWPNPIQSVCPMESFQDYEPGFYFFYYIKHWLSMYLSSFRRSSSISSSWIVLFICQISFH